MKLNRMFLLLSFIAISTLTYGKSTVSPLDDATWSASQWISVADAPIIDAVIEDGMRAADGAYWFTLNLTNEKEVSQALWMTTALGVYDLYVNGQIIGEEVLKPGFTHPEKTKLSFTYDITNDIAKGVGNTNCFADTKDFFHKWMRDMRDSQSEAGSFPGVAPKSQYGDEMSRLGWADAGVIVPWTIWKQFGDTNIINESWASMSKFMDHIAEVKYDHKALINENGNYQWADWLSYEPLESHSGRAWDANGLLPEAADYWSYLCAAYWAIDAEMMADMAKAIGKDEESKRYQQMATDARDYIRSTFLNEDGRFKTEILNTI